MMFLKILQNLQENTCARVSFFNKVAGPRPATLSKKKSGTDVSKCYEFSEISKNTTSTEHLWATASECMLP